MRSIRSTVILIVVTALACGATADTYLQGSGGDHAMSATNDRFYSGADKAFIGAAYDFSGVGFGGGWGTMISSQYFLSATHYHPGAGSSLTFYSGNSTSSPSYTATVESGSQIGSSDLWIGKLTAPIPTSANIAHYSVLSLQSFSAYVGMDIFTYGLPHRVGKNVISSVDTYTEGGETQIGMFYNYDEPGVGPSESYLMGGDSGGASFGVYNGQLVLLGEHFSNWGTSGLPGAPGNVWPTSGNGSWWSVDGFLPAMIDQVNAVTGNQLTVVSPVPEPITLLAVGTGLTGLVGYIRRRSRK